MNIKEARGLLDAIGTWKTPGWGFYIDRINNEYRIIACIVRASHSKEVLDIRNAKDLTQFGKAMGF